MIRSFIKRAAKKVLGRDEAPPPEPRRAAPRPPEPEPEPEEPALEIEGPTLKDWLAGESPVLLDIREPNELLAGHAQGGLLIPMNQVPHRLAEIPKGRKLVVYCAAGARSYGVAGYLREHGYPDAWSLVGGFGEYVSQGGAWVRPPAKAKFPITSRVRVAREQIDGVAIPPAHRVGTVQEIRETEAGLRYTVGLLDEGGAPFVVPDLQEDELSRA